MSDLQLNIVVPKKIQSGSSSAMNSKQKHFEKYMNRKKKKMEKTNSNSILHPRISKEHQSQTYNFTNSETAPTNYSRDEFLTKRPPSKFQTKPILKKNHLKEEPIKKDSEMIIENEEENNQEPEKPSYPSIFTSIDFESLSINEHLKKVLQGNNYNQMTKIQQTAIPLLLTKSNSLIKSETGSGKTLCYLVPIYELLMKRTEKVSRAHGTLALIICPTRELCIQVDEEARKLSKAAIWVVNGAIMGGESIKKEKARLRKGINILISTPGRLVYHLQNSQSFQAQSLEFLVLEESDRTLDMGFTKDIETIIDILSKRTPNWDKVQKILISANFSQKIKTLTLKMSSKELKYIGWEEKKGEMVEDQEFFEIEEMLKIPKSIKQEYVVLKEDQKIAFLINILRKAKEGSQKIMIFVATIDETEYLNHLLKLFEDISEKFKVFKLHGDIDQKTRTATYMDFKKKTGFSVLIATDVASRGLDFNCVDITILTSIPPRPIDYCNTIGRTGRIDQSGLSLLMLYEQELGYLDELRKNGIDELKKYKKIRMIEGSDNIRREIVTIIRNDYDTKGMAKRAYVSFMRAYNRNQKGRFFLKELNLQGLARSFGIEGGKYSKDEDYQEGIIKRKDKFNYKVHERFIKKTVIRSVKDLERMEFG